MIELTCPAEEGIEAAALRKETRYQELQVAIKAWAECKYFTIEVGARGLVGLRVHKVLLRIGLTPTAAKALCQRLSAVVARASYAIFLAHDSKTWAQSELIVISGPPSEQSCPQTKTGDGDDCNIPTPPPTLSSLQQTNDAGDRVERKREILRTRKQSQPTIPVGHERKHKKQMLRTLEPIPED